MTEPELLRLLVAPVDAGVRLDIYLARVPAIGSRRRAKELLDAGAVALPGNRRPPKAGLALDPGQAVEVRLLPEAPEPTVEQVAAGVEPLRVLHQDPFVVVIDKRPGLAAHPPEGARHYAVPTVATLAEAAFGPLPRLGGADRPGIVHRLDKDTSGVMLLARTEEAFHFLQSQFKARTIEKEYRCLSYGAARFDSDWIEAAIADHPTRADRMVVVREGGREAVTYYEVVERLGGYTHFRCLPKTGRTHQIRLHMETAGYSLVGDKVYRSRNQQHLALPPGAPPAERQCLHAYRIAFDHPFSHERMSFTAPIPADMTELLDWLRTHAR